MYNLQNIILFYKHFSRIFGENTEVPFIISVNANGVRKSVVKTFDFSETGMKFWFDQQMLLQVVSE